MVKRKTDEYFVDKIRTDLQFIIDHTRGLEQKEFENDEVLVDSVMYGNVDLSVIYYTVKDDIPTLLDVLKSI